MTDIPVPVQITLLVVAGVVLLALLAFTIYVLREIVHRIRVWHWLRNLEEEVELE